MAELIYPSESYAINGAAMEVYNVLGPGFLEAVYQEALALEFNARGIPFEAQKELSIAYKSHVLTKKYIADFVVYGKIIVEIKAQIGSLDVDKAQIINYLKATGFKLGILLNFRTTDKLDYHRLIRTPCT